MPVTGGRGKPCCLADSKSSCTDAVPRPLSHQCTEASGRTVRFSIPHDGLIAEVTWNPGIDGAQPREDAAWLRPSSKAEPCRVHGLLGACAQGCALRAIPGSPGHSRSG